MAELQNSRTTMEETVDATVPWSHAVFPACITRGGRTALLLVATFMPAAGCVHVDNLELRSGDSPKPVPTAPGDKEAPLEGPHWEKPILTGYEREILVKHGDIVEAGQRLVQYAERVREAVEYEVKKAELTVAEQASVLERLHKLVPSRAVSQQEIHAATTGLEQARISLAQVEIRLADLEVRAPFRGKVRIDATSNSPSISVYPVEDSQSRYFLRDDNASNGGE